MASRENEMAEQEMYGQMGLWSPWNLLRTRYEGLSTAEWSTLRTAAGVPGGITKADAVGFVRTREDEALVEVTKAVEKWRNTP